MIFLASLGAPDAAEKSSAVGKGPYSSPCSLFYERPRNWWTSELSGDVKKRCHETGLSFPAIFILPNASKQSINQIPHLLIWNLQSWMHFLKGLWLQGIPNEFWLMCTASFFPHLLSSSPVLIDATCCLENMAYSPAGRYLTFNKSYGMTHAMRSFQSPWSLWDSCVLPWWQIASQSTSWSIGSSKAFEGF